MSRKWKTVMACFMVLALVTTLCFSCAEEEEKEKVTIIIGNMTDLTGVAAPALVPMTWALEDMVREVNAGTAYGVDPLPEGVELRVISYDTAFNPARFIPGYEWLRQQGAEVIVSVFNDCSETLKPLAARDKVAILGMATSIPMVEPPGWVFSFDVPTEWAANLMLQWIGDHWDYEGTGRSPTIATVGWNDAWGVANEKAASEYCEARSDDFDYVGGYLAPVGTLTWSGEITKVLNVDYVQVAANGGLMPASFMDQYRRAGGTGINFDTESQSAYIGFITDYAGWDAMDGKLNDQVWGWWGLPWPEVQYAKDVVHKYHPDEAEDIIHAGMGYLGGGSMQLFALRIVVATINRVGAENFSGQAFYDTAINFMEDWAGSMKGFTPTRRYVTDDMIMLEWDADTEDLIMISDGWLKVVIE